MSALSLKELEAKTSSQLITIQGAYRGIRTEKYKARFDAIGKILESRGVQGLDYNDWKPKSDSDKAKKSINCQDVFNKKAIETAEIDDNISDHVRNEILVASKHVQLYMSASSRGKDFDITIPDTRKLLTTKKCAYTGVKMDDGNPMHVRTVERIDGEKGYVKGNLVPVTKKANALKNMLFENDKSEFRMEDEEFMRFAAAMFSQMKGNK